MSQVLKGKVALVAGATRGAGRGIAVELGSAGATVYLTRVFYAKIEVLTSLIANIMKIGQLAFITDFSKTS